MSYANIRTLTSGSFCMSVCLCVCIVQEGGLEQLIDDMIRLIQTHQHEIIPNSSQSSAAGGGGGVGAAGGGVGAAGGGEVVYEVVD